MRIAVVYPSFAQHGGAETYLTDMMRGLAALGHDIHLFTARYDEALFPLPDALGVRVMLVGTRGFMEGLPGTLTLIRVLSHALRGYDLVIPVNFPANVWVLLGWHGAPSVWLCMEPKRNLYPQIMYAEAGAFRPNDYRRAADYTGRAGLARLIRDDLHVLLPYPLRAMMQRLLDRAAVRRARHVLAISPYIEAKVRDIYRHSRVHLVWAGVPQTRLAPQPLEPIILLPTRLEPIKNVEVVLRALRLIENRGAYRLVIVGTGSDQSRLNHLAAELDLDDGVAFAGFVTATERDSLYARCAFVVYPSLAEPLGLPCIEAALAGKAVIASNAGGPAFIIRDGETGILVDVTDAEQVAAVMARLIANPDEAQRLGRAAQAHVEPMMELSHWIERFDRLLQRIVQDSAV